MFSVYLKNHGIHEKSKNVLQSTARKIVLDLEENWKWTVQKISICYKGWHCW